MAKDYDYDQLFPGRFVKAGLFQGKQVTLTIAEVELERLPDKKGKKLAGESEPHKTKAILSFRGKDLQLVLNKTNGERIKGMFGRRTGAWLGKRVTFAPVMVKAFGKQELAIRVIGSPDIERDMEIVEDLGQTRGTRIMKKTSAAAAPAASTEPQEEPPPRLEDEEAPPHDPVTGELQDVTDGELT